MDASNIPFGVPVIIHSVIRQKNLQNPVGTTEARCLQNNRDLYEQMILHRQPNDKVAIQSVWNGRFLHIQTGGSCVFDSQEVTERGLFSLETNSTCSLFFVSSYTGNVLLCNEKCVPSCVNKNRQAWEEWRIMEPRTTSASVTQALPVQVLNQDRQNLILELVKYGKTSDEIEQIVTRLFEAKST